MAGPMLRIGLSDGGRSLQDIASKLGATDEQIDRALASTLNRAARWLLTQSVRKLSVGLGIQQKILRRRVRSFRMQGEPGKRTAKVWYGVKAIDFADLHPRQTADGVKADGGRFEEGAFIGRSKRSGRLKVFKRKTSKPHPLEVVTADISDQALEMIEFKIVNGPDLDAEVMKIFERELKWRTTTKS